MPGSTVEACGNCGREPWAPGALRHVRQRAGKTQATLAALLGYHEAHISAIETGRSRCTPPLCAVYQQLALERAPAGKKPNWRWTRPWAPLPRRRTARASR